jgi:Histidine kinase-, DNA gyrase B-, and HSP90-like ATPase
VSETAYFSVDTKLAKLLGETYRSTEAALKELVDNAWDSDADTVWITLPREHTDDVVMVRDDGSGMTPAMVREEYLAIARDRRSRKGERSAKYKRAIKGRKGIGKFAGLATARFMRVTTAADYQRTTLQIDRDEVLGASTDLERVPLPLDVAACEAEQHGTTVELTSLSKDLLAPRDEPLRAMLFYEYGRASGMQIIVNGSPVTFDDALGPTHKEVQSFEGSGDVQLRFSIAEKRPRYAGFVIKVGGKAVGKPSFLGLDEDPEVPRWLLNRIFGEIEIPDLPDGHVTADWGAIFENSVPFQAVREWAQKRTREELQSAYKRDFGLRKAHLKRDIDARLAKLPEHRRAYAEEAVNKVLWRFYREHGERFATLANVMLDALEHDEYWSILQRIDAASLGDVAQFAEALEAFGLLELAMMSERARHRLHFLDRLEELVAKPATVEKEVHRALEGTLWVLGTKYALMASNRTLRTIVSQYMEKKYAGNRPDERPDLLLAQDAGDRYLLIEFKRPSHELTREDEAQAMRYRDEIATYLPAKAIDVLLLGGRRERMDTRYDTPDRVYQTYAGLIAQARYELQWLLRDA